MAVLATTISLAVSREIRTRILNGELPPGGRINEVHLARALEVSRTPLREALTRLVGEAFVDVRPNRGFFVRPLSVAEVTQLYPIRARLDPWALKLAGVPSTADLNELADINHQISRSAADAAAVVDLDDRWHEKLVSACPNRALVELIRQMMWRTRRYELLYFRTPAHVTAAVRTHAKIIASLRRKQLAAACRQLEDNMREASPALLRAVAELSQ
jgi:DNA-binding GntR family transcriptional regulator